MAGIDPKRQKISDDSPSPGELQQESKGDQEQPSDLAKGDSSSDEENTDDWPIVERHELTGARFAQYQKEVIESNGFKVSSYPDGFVVGGIVPVFMNEASKQLLPDLSKQAIDFYNKSQDARFEFVELVNANVQCVAGMMYYITFKAKEHNDSCQTFQARVWVKICNRGTEVRSCVKA